MGEILISDDLDNEIVLAKPARRIVSLYGSFSAILDALDSGDLVAGRTAKDMHAPEALSIGTHMAPNLELVLSLKPDLVLIPARKESSALADTLGKLNINVATFNIDSFKGLFQAVEKIAILIGKDREGEKLINGWKQRLDKIRRKSEKLEPVEVFYEIRYPRLLCAGQKGIVNEIITLAGGKNVVDIPKKIVQLNEEILLAKNPEVYIYQKGPMNPRPEDPAKRPIFAGLSAISNGHILEVGEEEFARPGPSSIDAVENLYRWLHAGKDIKK